MADFITGVNTNVYNFCSRILYKWQLFWTLKSCFKMKQLHRNLEKDSSGLVLGYFSNISFFSLGVLCRLNFEILCELCCSVIGLMPDEAEDMWHAYNLIAVGDRLRATTIRYKKKFIQCLYYQIPMITNFNMWPVWMIPNNRSWSITERDSGETVFETLGFLPSTIICTA